MKLIRPCFILLVSLALGSGARSESIGGRSLPFSLGMGAAGMGLGGGMTSLTVDETAVYYNPASLSRLEYQEFSASHAVLYSSTMYNTAVWAYPITENQGIGLGIMRMGTRNIPRYVDYEEQGKFGYSLTQFVLSYGRLVSGPVSVGGNLKVINQELDRFSDYGVGFDLATTVELTKHLALGVIGRDLIAAELKLDQTREELPTSFMGGIALRDIKLSKSLLVSGSAELEKYEDGDPRVHAGAEIAIEQTVLLRAGYDADQVTIGTGLRYGKIIFDYALKFEETIDDQHTFGLSILLGPSVTERVQRREAERRAGSGEEERRRRFELNRGRGKEFFDQFQLDSAVIYYQRALAFDESNQEIIGTIAAIESARQVQKEQEDRLRQTESEMRQSIKNYYDQANQLYSKGYHRPALDLLNLVFDIQPDNSQALELKRLIEEAIDGDIQLALRAGDSATSVGRTSDALDSYNRVLAYDSTNARALEGKRRALAGLDLAKQLTAAVDAYNKQNFAEARRLFAAILEANPNDRLAQDYMRRMSENVKRSSSFEDLQNDKVYWPLYLEGLRHMRNKEYQKAIDVWTRVLQAYPDNPNTLDNIAQASLRLESSDGQK